ncbi:MAG: hydrogenase maturation nickel metallochaperone HypA [Candidatus Methanomethylicia archaeon]|nr:hydrogenase maturation nickel metallochaperone HypA [Candidatus Methanomethylicia archaeon]
MGFEYNMQCRDCRNKWSSNKISSSIKCPKCGSHNVKLLPSSNFKTFIAPYA